jgi:hypothetical protein
MNANEIALATAAAEAFENGWRAGHHHARAEMAPLVEAIMDTLLMFEDIDKARQLPAYGNVAAQYIAMGKQLRRLLDASGLKQEHEQVAQ